MAGKQTEPAKLWRLQKLDVTARALEDAIARPPGRAEYDRLATSAQGALRELKAHEAGLADLRQKQRRHERDLRSLEAEAAALEKKLYSGEVTNARELGSVGQKLALTRQRRAQLEEQLLALMQCTEDSEASTVATRQRAQRLTRQCKAREVELHAETTRLRAELAEAVEQRQALAAQVAPAWLARYERMKQKLGPDVVAPVEGDMCGRCRVFVPGPLVAQASAGNTPAYCENCGRILCVP